jgi:hypothetical protein
MGYGEANRLVVWWRVMARRRIRVLGPRMSRRASGDDDAVAQARPSHSSATVRCRIVGNVGELPFLGSSLSRMILRPNIPDLLLARGTTA